MANYKNFTESKLYNYLKKKSVCTYTHKRVQEQGEDSVCRIIQNIGTVANDTKEDEITLQNVTIIGVPELDCYKTCLKCKASVEPSTSLLVEVCSQQSCKMMQRINVGPNYATAKLMIMYDDGQQAKNGASLPSRRAVDE